jgi:hypothetical protein
MPDTVEGTQLWQPFPPPHAGQFHGAQHHGHIRHTARPVEVHEGYLPVARRACQQQIGGYHIPMPQTAVMHTTQVCRYQTHHLLQASRTIRQRRTICLERDHICQGCCDIGIVLHEAPTPFFKHT